MDEMICRQHNHHCLTDTLMEHLRSEADRRSGISAERFDENILCRQCGQLTPHLIRLLCAGDHEYVFLGHNRIEPIDGVLNHRTIADDFEQLLRRMFAATRPEPRTDTTGNNQGIHFHMSDFILLSPSQTAGQRKPASENIRGSG